MTAIWGLVASPVTTRTAGTTVDSTPTDCFFCHASEYESSTRPNHARVGFSTQCEECHTTALWQDSRFAGGPGFDHSTFFALAGSHRGASCGACHQAEVFAGTPRDSFSCHQADFAATAEPPHGVAGFVTTCEPCHTESAWEGATFDHESVFAPRLLLLPSRGVPGDRQPQPRFRLEGAHLKLSCDECHPVEIDAERVFSRYRPLGTTCEACHAGRLEPRDSREP